MSDIAENTYLLTPTSDLQLCACVRVDTVTACGRVLVCVKKEKDGVRAGGEGGERSLLLPPSLSHFQPALNFDPPSAHMDAPDLLEALRRGAARNFQPRREEHLRQEEKSPVRSSGAEPRSSGAEQRGTKIHKKCIGGAAATRRGGPACGGRGGAGSAQLRTEGAVQQQRSPGERSCGGGERKAELPAAAEAAAECVCSRRRRRGEAGGAGGALLATGSPRLLPAPGSTPAPPPDCVGVCVCARARASGHTLCPLITGAVIDPARARVRSRVPALRDPADQDNN